jgi:hypothetical protein
MVKRNLKVKLIFIAFLITIILLIYLFNSNVITESIDKPIFPVSYNLEIPNPIETPEVKADMISVEAIKCTRKSISNYQIDLRIKNLGIEKASVEFYPSGTIINLSPGDIKRVDLFIHDIERKLIAINGSKNYEVDIPFCMDEFGSGGNSGITSTGANPSSGVSPSPDPSPTQNPDPSLPPINPIPEFPWIGLPVIFVTLLAFLFRRK